MVHYKLTYFPLRGAAEVIRQIFAVAGQEYEDVRIPREEWPAHKDAAERIFLAQLFDSEMPFGQVPVLEVDGMQLPQSMAIARYLARQFGLVGKNEWEEALVDSLADQYTDTLQEIRPYLMVLVGMAPGDIEQQKKEVLLPATHKAFSYFTSFLKRNPSGFLVGDSLTYVDLLVADGVAGLAAKAPESLYDFPEIVAHLDKIHSIPAIKHWRENRPKTQF